MARKKCSPLQKSIEWCQGRTVKPGIRRDIYYLDKSAIVKWPTRPMDELGRVTSSSYDEGSSFVLAESEFWRKLETQQSKSKPTSEPQGELPSQTQLNKLEIVIPGTGPDESALCVYVNNTDSVFLVTDNHGRIRVYGSEDYETKSTVTQDLGEGPTGTAATTLSVEATDATLPPFYFGEIVTEDGVINEQVKDIP